MESTRKERRWQEGSVHVREGRRVKSRKEGAEEGKDRRGGKDKKGERKESRKKRETAAGRKRVRRGRKVESKKEVQEGRS